MIIVPFVHYGRASMNHAAHVETKTEDRVIGFIKGVGSVINEAGRQSNKTFNVKHDGTKFSVGSGSGKTTYYFKNIGFNDRKSK